MNQTVERRIREGRREQLLRLADQGERNGVRILVDHRTGEHVATSATDPTRCYHVGVERGCTCKGYAVWSRCQHHSLLLSELGLIEDTPEDRLADLLWGDLLEEQPRPLEAQYVRARTPHPRLPAGALAPLA